MNCKQCKKEFTIETERRIIKTTGMCRNCFAENAKIDIKGEDTKTKMRQCTNCLEMKPPLQSFKHENEWYCSPCLMKKEDEQNTLQGRRVPNKHQTAHV